MPYHLDDTIAAIASPPGGAARGIVRLSGPNVGECLATLFEPDDEVALIEVTWATALAGVLNGLDLAAPLPCDLYFWPNSRSYTRQPMAEVHTVGSPPLLECVLKAVGAAGARVAEPGEFTLRAFLGGRLDLTQAEAVLGVIDAGDRRQFAVALQQLAGGVAGPMTQVRDQLLDLLAHLEAGLDFVEEDIEFISTEEIDAQLAEAGEAVNRLAEQMVSRGQSSDLVRAVFLGWPNVGKSSLFNALLERSQALVSEAAGTTRDYLSAELELGDVRLELIDTAGAETLDREEGVSIESAAQSLAGQQHAGADLRLLCLDSSRPLNAWERTRLAETDATHLVVLTKSDCPRQMDHVPGALATSAFKGAGLDELRARLRESALTVQRGDATVVAATATRCCESLRLAAASLDRARELAQQHAGEELVAAEVRVALDELGKVVGAVYTDDVLDRIFSRFCIGK